MTSPHLLPDRWERENGWDFWADYDSGDWEPETHAAIQQYVTKGSTYVDIGAWVGPTVLWAAPLAGRVVAVEPDPVAFELLDMNTKMCPTVELVNGAIAAETGEAFCIPHGQEGFGSSMSRLDVPNGAGVWDSNQQFPVSCWTLPDFFEAHKIRKVSLVKMDIEGGEADVLETVCPFLAELGIPLLVSMHEDWWSHPVKREWFDCFSELQGSWGNPAPMLAIP